MTLTNTQISEIRLLSTDVNEPFLISAEWADLLYTQANSDLNTTVYNAMAIMKSKLADMLVRASDKRQEAWLDRRIDALCERMKTYENLYGIGSTMVVTTADLGTDTDLEDETDEPFWWQFL
jgi:hypothetical protein